MAIHHNASITSATPTCMTRMTYRGSSLDSQLWCIQGIRCPWSYTHTIYSNVLSIHLHNLSTHYHFTIPRGPSSKMFKVLVPELLGCFHTCEPSGSMPAFPRNPQLCHAAVSFHDAKTDSKYQFGLQTSGSELFTSVGSLNMFEYVWILGCSHGNSLVHLVGSQKYRLHRSFPSCGSIFSANSWGVQLKLRLSRWPRWPAIGHCQASKKTRRHSLDTLLTIREARFDTEHIYNIYI